MNKRIIITVSIILMGWGIASAQPWTPLFNGKDLSGWETLGQGEWSVRDGLLVGTQTTGKGGDLITTDQWQDFELRFVYRITWPANTGIWFRFNKEANKGYQFDILKYKNPVAFSGSLYCPGKLFVTSNLDESLENRDRWNEGLVRAQGDSLTLRLNGHLVGQCQDDTLSSGRIGIQVHGGNEFKGMEVIIKQIEIRPLVPEATEVSPAFQAELDQAIDLLLEDKWGVGTKGGETIEAVAKQAYQTVEKQALESRLLDVLGNPQASHRAKHLSLFVLNIVGSNRCIPTLEGLLTEPTLAHMACNILDKLPGHPASQALMKGLVRCEGRLKIQIITVLGTRGDDCAVSALTPLLTGSNTDVTNAAAMALGRIGSTDGVSALRDFKQNATGASQNEATDACLHLAEKLAAQGKTDLAVAQYRWLAGQDKRDHVQAAILNGLVTADPENGTKTLLAALNTDAADQGMLAARIAGRSPDPAMTSLLIKALGNKAKTGRIHTLKALEYRADVTARPAVIGAVSDADADVRLAALTTLIRIAQAADVDILLDRAGQGSEKEQEKASKALEMCADPVMNAALVKRLATTRPARQVFIIETLGRRHYTQGVSELMSLTSARETLVRQAALDYVGQFGTGEHVADLIKVLNKTKRSSAIEAVEKAMSRVVQRSQDRDLTAGQLVKAAKTDSIPNRCALLRILGNLGGSQALRVLRQAQQDQNADVSACALDTLLRDWPDASATKDLMDIAKNTDDRIQRILALRGLVRVTQTESAGSTPTRLMIYRQAYALAQRPDEKRLILSGVGRLAHADALTFVTERLSDSSIRAEAEVAAVQIAKELLKTRRAEATKVLKQIQKQTKNQELKKTINRALR